MENPSANDRRLEAELRVRSQAQGDDLDRKVARTTVDLAHIKTEYEECLQRLGRIEHAMTQYISMTNIRVKEVALRWYSELPTWSPAMKDELQAAGCVCLAREILAQVRSCKVALETYFQGKQIELGDGLPPDLKGRIRALRSEIERERPAIKDSEIFIAEHEGQADAAAAVERTRVEVAGWRRRQHQLRGLEAQLVNATEYTPASEEQQFLRIIANHFPNPTSLSQGDTHGNASERSH